MELRKMIRIQEKTKSDIEILRENVTYCAERLEQAREIQQMYLEALKLFNTEDDRSGREHVTEEFISPNDNEIRKLKEEYRNALAKIKFKESVLLILEDKIAKESK